MNLFGGKRRENTLFIEVFIERVMSCRFDTRVRACASERETRAFSSRGKANLRVGSRLVVPASYDGPISPRYKYEP